MLKSYEGRIFANDHKPEPYYASGIALLSVEKWINSNTVDRDLRSYKHQLLMLLRILISGQDVPALNSRRIATYSLKIADTIRDSEKGCDYFARAKKLLRESLARFDKRSPERLSAQRNPPHRLRAFTEQLKDDCRSGEPIRTVREVEGKSSVGSVETGGILWYDSWRNYGFIERADGGGSIFVHQTEIAAVPWHLRTAGTRVKYVVSEDPKPGRAGSVVASRVELESTGRGSTSV